MEIQYLVNAGLYLAGKRSGLLIDGIHHGEKAGLSAMPPGLFRNLIEKRGDYQLLRGLLFTHLHVDHYDPDLVERMLQKDIRFSLWGPGIMRHNLDWCSETPHGARIDIGEFRCFAYQ